jgi:two-component system, NtrC family, response regulator AtoC
MPTVRLVVSSRGQTRTFDLGPAAALVIGRGADCEVRLDDALVSRKHATLRVERGLEIVDHGSHNGTIVFEPKSELPDATMTATGTRARIAPETPVRLSESSIVQIGGAMLSFESAGAAEVAFGGDEVVVDPSMVRVYQLAARVAASDLPVLVLGESGVGKEVLARFLHRRSNRAAEALVAINCGALPDNLLEAELFGYERGAFSGAVKTTAGLFETAHRGTLFLDEVGELSPAFQTKLLRVLETGEIRRIGGRDVISVDVRCVAATNRDLSALVSEGAFREDLFYRLNGIALVVPPLRDRRAEIVPLAQRFLADANREQRLGDDAKAALERHEWPGNARELRNTIRRASVLATSKTIGAEHLQFARTEAPPPPAGGRTADELRQEASSVEKQQILDALDRCGGNQTRAAELLGITRRALITRLERYEITRPRQKNRER